MRPDTSRDHSDDGVTQNDNSGVLPNYPVVTGLESRSTLIEGTYAGQPETAYVLEFFASTQCDASGFGGAELVVGNTLIVTDQDGTASFSAEFDTTIAYRHVVSATATGPDGTTSELSQCTASVGSERIASTDVPDAFRLSRNYPSPFNPSTTIRIEVPERAEVRLEVFDALGRLIAVPLSATLAPGRYEQRFDAAGLSSGVYYYRLTAGSFVEARSMVVFD